MSVDLTWIANKGNALQYTNGSDDEGKVGRDLEGKVKGDLRQVCRQIPVNQTHLSMPAVYGLDVLQILQSYISNTSIHQRLLCKAGAQHALRLQPY